MEARDNKDGRDGKGALVLLVGVLSACLTLFVGYFVNDVRARVQSIDAKLEDRLPSKAWVAHVDNHIQKAEDPDTGYIRQFYDLKELVGDVQTDVHLLQVKRGK